MERLSERLAQDESKQLMMPLSPSKEAHLAFSHSQTVTPALASEAEADGRAGESKADSVKPVSLAILLLSANIL